MPSPFNTFNRPAAIIAAVVALVAWLLCALELGSAYTFSRWLTVIRAPLLACSLYVYLVVAFNIAGSPFNWARAALLGGWVILGSLVTLLLAFGFVWAFMLLAKVIPGLAYIPLALGLTENIFYSFILVVPIAFMYSAFALAKSYRHHSHA